MEKRHLRKTFSYVTLILVNLRKRQFLIIKGGDYGNTNKLTKRHFSA